MGDIWYISSFDWVLQNRNKIFLKNLLKKKKKPINRLTWRSSGSDSALLINEGGLGSIHGWGTRFHMLQLRPSAAK